MRPLLLACFFLASSFLCAQPGAKQKFAAAAYAGVNLSQIDGDYYFGYNKIGVRFGAETQILLTPKSFVTVGVGFAQAGAKSNRSERKERGNNAIDLRLNTVEVPLLYNLRLGNKRFAGKKDNFKLYRSGVLQLGFVVSRLTSYTIETSGKTERLPRNFNFAAVEDEYRDWDVKVMVGVTIPTGLRGALFIQHNKSFVGLYRPNNSAYDEVLPLYPYSLSMGYKHILY
ncbi:outer membrane beta-barrel protein [Lewinella sp. 4G2]|uniref:outer membrane beta-barrel protein n=1 Tax=Lewinella sp. 4G2 TaxID=1803372 RepID=UPI0007B4B47E|nr:outer membrane beta-barrel protein [Lewinella sp. 4G2]OAV44763.1 hypothetical protein A3850_009790 [Lewinella sp. 4G2]